MPWYAWLGLGWLSASLVPLLMVFAAGRRVRRPGYITPTLSTASPRLASAVRLRRCMNDAGRSGDAA